MATEGGLTSKLPKSIDSEQKHNTDDHIIYNQKQRTTSTERLTRTNKKTSTDGAADSDHLHVSSLQIPLQLPVLTHLDIPMNGFWRGRLDITVFLFRNIR